MDFPDVEPLFTSDDILTFDRYADGDPYGDAGYIERFRFLLDAIKKQIPIRIRMTNRKGSITYTVLMPEYLEYSEKDDKWRLLGSGSRFIKTVNLGRIISVKPYEKPYTAREENAVCLHKRTVEFELYDDRNVLERALLHFAHFEKEAEKIEEGKYRVCVSYDEDDEAEMVIRMLSFGPLVKVTAPQNFVDSMKKKLKSQKNWKI